MSKKQRISTDGGNGLDANPFGALSGEGLPDAPKKPAPAPKPTPAPAKVKKRGRVDLQRQKGGRGGKVVTIISGEGMNTTGPQELDAMLKHFKTRLGCGGKVQGKTVELQGDVRDAVEPELAQRGYRVVRVGG
ncbi:translation initiation factor [Cerasicoccus fimbriatus]|uniref:translation initiation factor n=1 Tax=Cerasicoccus fimbriatus TaxID=3014554 RepID=UPI0022B3BFF6|nr:translation initiation factor [Cerasicoccus sp. TK19100]